MRSVSGFEYVGLPGAGKTTAAIALVGDFDVGVRVCQFSFLFGTHRRRGQRYLFRFLSVLAVLVLEPFDLIRLVRSLCWSAQPRLKVFVGLLAQYCCYRFSLRIAHYFYDCYVADEGVLHFVWAVALDSPHPVCGVFNRFSFLLHDKGVQHIHIDIEEEEMKRRLESRSGNSRFERNPLLHDKGVSNMKQLAKICSQRPGVLLSEISGSSEERQ